MKNQNITDQFEKNSDKELSINELDYYSEVICQKAQKCIEKIYQTITIESPSVDDMFNTLY